MRTVRWLWCVVIALMVLAVSPVRAAGRDRTYTIVGVQSLHAGINLFACRDTACHNVDDTPADPAAVLASTQLAQAITYLHASRTARTYLEALTQPLIVLVDPTDECLDTMGTSSSGHWIVTWNPLRALMQTDGSGISPAVSLMHELGHAVHYFRDAGLTRRLAAENDIMYDNAEERRTIDEVERPVARELNEGLRWNHLARGVQVDSVVLVGHELSP